MDKQKKTFLVSIVTLLVLMIFTYVLTFTMECEGLSLLKFIASPFLVLGSDSSSTIIAIIIFLIIIGGIVEGLNQCGFLEYMINKIVSKYGNKKYKLIAVLVFFFMAMGSLVGSFEEVVPLVPIVVALAIDLGFDALTGVGMSLLAVGCGFAAGVANPFTVGVAQGLAGLPMFSGISLRLVSFILIYFLLLGFLFVHTKRVDKKESIVSKSFESIKSKDKALNAFAIIMGVGLLIVLSSPFLTFLQDFTMIIIALMFLIAGIVAILLSETPFKQFLKYFKTGAFNIAPSILLILMASSIRYIMEESGLIITLLDKFSSTAGFMNHIQLILFVYLICLIMNFFIPSGSAKAFLLMPLLIPLAAEFGLSPQLCIVAYAFGDGFSNVFYPTNPALLISLGLIDMDYGTWFKYSWKFQLLNLLLTSGLLIAGLLLGY
ncbi:MAG: Na+/H+ antiporter NhaC family protein [Erysipelotrichaceae bacterium]|nr:Na+/H+ antiporter NhaC family protein [Erysipelotrichaceae bacterium]